MSEISKIEWTRSTFNAWIGCTKVSPGCDNCYAEVSTPARSMKIHWGAGQQRHRTAAANWNQVRRWNAKAAETGEFWPVFCASLADIFDNEVPEEWRADFWALVRECPHLTFQVLTKRIGNVKRMLPADWSDGYPNVWLGISVVNQEEADRDIPKLLRIKAKVRWLSMEPLLGPVDLDPYLPPMSGLGWVSGCRPVNYDGKPLLHWIVAGGESGHDARPMHPDWARGLRDQCQAAGVPFLFKQWGGWIPAKPERSVLGKVLVVEGIAPFTDKPEWHNFEDGVAMARIGKKAAGRLLDGIEHNGYPITRVA